MKCRKVQPNLVPFMSGTLTADEADEVRSHLAHCASCDTEKKAEILVRLEKEACEARKICAEAEVLEMEVQRRSALIAAGQLDPFEPAPVLVPASGP